MLLHYLHPLRFTPAIKSTLFSLSASLAVILSDAFSERVYIEVPLVAFFLSYQRVKK